MMVQTKCKLNNTELVLKLLHIQCKEIGNSEYYEETTGIEKWQSDILPEYCLISNREGLGTSL